MTTWSMKPSLIFTSYLCSFSDALTICYFELNTPYIFSAYSSGGSGRYLVFFWKRPALFVPSSLEVLQSMPKLHLQNLSLKALASKLYVEMECEQKENQMIAAFVQEACLQDIPLNTLFTVIKHRPQSLQAEILITIDFQQTVARWLSRDELAANGLERALSPRSQQQLVELIDIIISSAAESPFLMQEILLISQKILTCFYRVVERSDNSILRGRYLDCISKIFRVKPDVFNVSIYAEMLSLTHEKVDQFYEFLDFYLLQTQRHDSETVGFILIGFSRRMKMFSERNVLTKLERRGIIKAYLKLLEHLKSQVHTVLPQKIWNEHPQIFEYLKIFVSREFNHHELSRVFNTLISVYMSCQMRNVYKFQFVLSIFKHILLKSPSLFSFLLTDAVGGQDFVSWFIITELSFDKGKEVLECYLKNSSSLEFLLVMSIYYLSHFPDRAGEVARYMAWIGLLEEAKCFLHKDHIKEFFQVFYDQINEREYFDDFLDRIEDRTHRLDA